MTQQQWARPFNLTTASGAVYHGVEFPSGRVMLDHSEEGLAVAAVSLEHLLAMPDLAGATIDRGGSAPEGAADR